MATTDSTSEYVSDRDEIPGAAARRLREVGKCGCNAADRPIPADIRLIDVVGVAIVRDGLVLCALRPPGGNIGGMWEFAGGKVEPGETHYQALIREAQEELGVIIEPKEKIAETTMAYPVGLITLTTYYCELISGEPTNTEHEKLAWIPAAELLDLNWAPADLAAATQIQKDLLSH